MSSSWKARQRFPLQCEEYKSVLPLYYDEKPRWEPYVNTRPFFSSSSSSSSWTARSAVPHNNAKGANIDKIH